MAMLRIAGADVELPPVLESECVLSAFHPRHLVGLTVDEIETGVVPAPADVVTLAKIDGGHLVNLAPSGSCREPEPSGPASLSRPPPEVLAVTLAIPNAFGRSCFRPLFDFP